MNSRLFDEVSFTFQSSYLIDIYRLYLKTDEYLDHVQYLREQYIEYDQYELHQSIGVSASKLLRPTDVKSYFEELTEI